MIYDVGILDGHRKGWGVRVPGLRGVYGGGNTSEPAIVNAIGAARKWAAHEIASRRKVPLPRSVQTGRADRAVAFNPAAGESTVMIPVTIDAGVAVKANISLDAGQLAALKMNRAK
jgi:predicted RNase H-like HicB family nuclease